MTTAVFATEARGRVSAYNLYCLTPAGNSLKAGFVNLYTRSSLDLRYKGIVLYSIDLCQLKYNESDFIKLIVSS